MKKSTIIIVILLSNTLCLLAQSSFTSNNIPLSLSNPTKERQEFEFRSNSSSSFDFLDIFDEVEQFEEESLIFQLGSGIGTTRYKNRFASRCLIYRKSLLEKYRARLESRIPLVENTKNRSSLQVLFTII